MPAAPCTKRLDDERGGPIAVLDDQPFQLGEAVVEIAAPA